MIQVIFYFCTKSLLIFISYSLYPSHSLSETGGWINTVFPLIHLIENADCSGGFADPLVLYNTYKLKLRSLYPLPPQGMLV